MIGAAYLGVIAAAKRAAALETGDVLQSWATSMSNSTPFGDNLTGRTVIPASRIIDQHISSMRLRLNTGNGAVSKVYVGRGKVSSDNYDFDGAPSQVFFGGSAGLASGGLDIWSDPVSISLDGTVPIVVSYLSNSVFNLIRGPAPGFLNFTASGDSAEQQDVSGYSPYFVDESVVLSGFELRGEVHHEVLQVSASGTAYESSATSISRTLPVGEDSAGLVADGDLMLVWLMHRAAVTSVPSGWELVDTQSCTNGSVTQYLSVYKKTWASADAGQTATWTCASTGRLGILNTAWRKSGGCSVVATAKAAQNNANTNTMNIAPTTATEDGQIAVGGCTMILAATDGATTITPSAGALLSVPSVSDNRMAVAYLRRNDGEIYTGTMVSSAAAGLNGVASVSVLLG